MIVDLPAPIKEAVVYSAREWPRTVNAEALLRELNALATRVYLLSALGTCGDCRHANDEAALLPSLNTYCTNRLGFYNGKLMEKSARCEKWQAKS